MSEVNPHHYEDNIPVFMPSFQEFSNFQQYCTAIDKFGQTAGLAKIIPPEQWKLAQPALTPFLKAVNIVTPITQIIQQYSSTPGSYMSTNIESRKSYTIQDWFDYGKNEITPPSEIELLSGRRTGRSKPNVPVKNAAAVKKTKKVEPAEALAVKKDEKVESVEIALPLGENIGPQTIPQAVSTVVPVKPKKAKLPTFKLSFDPYAVKEDYKNLSYIESLESSYWKNITYQAPSYGADMVGSLFEKTKSGGSWNLNRLDNLLNKVDTALPGVNVPYLYFGLWKATFPFHVEDMDLYSINYIHFGAPKQWYVIPPGSSDKLERFASNLFSKEANRCPDFLRHKSCIISPSLLQKNSIPVSKIVHREGEFMITYPKGYHQGYNLGFNCAESVNFALDRWIDIGIKAGHCKCTHDSVKIDVAALFGQDPLLSSRPNVKRKPASMEAPRGKKMMYAKEAPIKAVKYDGPVCVLCGGPGEESSLVGTDMEGKLAHVECGKGVPETSIGIEMIEGAPTGKQVVLGIRNVPKGRWNLKCDVCKLAKSNGSMSAGAPIQCIKGACKRAFHVPCAKRYKFNEETQIGECFCHQHDPNAILIKKEKNRHILEVEAKADYTAGRRVKVKWGGFTYEGIVQENIEAEQCCVVAFDQGVSKVNWATMVLM